MMNGFLTKIPRVNDKSTLVLGDTINTAGEDMCWSFSPDGKKFFGGWGLLGNRIKSNRCQQMLNCPSILPRRKVRRIMNSTWEKTAAPQDVYITLLLNTKVPNEAPFAKTEYVLAEKSRPKMLSPLITYPCC